MKKHNVFLKYVLPPILAVVILGSGTWFAFAIMKLMTVAQYGSKQEQSSEISTLYDNHTVSLMDFAPWDNAQNYEYLWTEYNTPGFSFSSDSLVNALNYHGKNYNPHNGNGQTNLYFAKVSQGGMKETGKLISYIYDCTIDYGSEKRYKVSMIMKENKLLFLDTVPVKKDPLTPEEIKQAYLNVQEMSEHAYEKYTSLYYERYDRLEWKDVYLTVETPIDAFAVYLRQMQSAVGLDIDNFWDEASSCIASKGTPLYTYSSGSFFITWESEWYNNRSLTLRYSIADEEIQGFAFSDGNEIDDGIYELK